MKTPNIKNLKKCLLPLLVILLASILLKILKTSGSGQNTFFLLTLTKCLFSFLFGLTLHLGRKKRRQNIISKIIIGFFMIYLFIYQLDILPFKNSSYFFNYLGLEKVNLYFLYIYFGWLFFN